MRLYEFIILFIIVAFVFIEIISGFSLGYYQQTSTPLLRSSIYQNESWVKILSQEQNEAYNFTYESFTGYKPHPYTGVYVNIDNNSLRKTWNPITQSNLTIYCFGGSTMWGTDARDNYTIPSLLSKKLNDLNIHTTVYNYGMSGYDSNSELIQLQMELKKGNIPDIVIFYDGVNDPCNAYINKQPGAIPNYFTRKQQYDYFQNSNHGGLAFNLLLTIATQSDAIKLLKTKIKIIDDIHSGLNQSELENLGYKSSEYYISNKNMIESICAKYNIKSYFFIQPYMSTRLNPTDEEKQIFNNINKAFPGMNTTCNIFYEKIQTESFNQNIIYIGDAFNEYDKSIYIDDCHISEFGNEIIVNKIIEKIFISA